MSAATPTLRSAWSSTERTRIRLGLVPISFFCLPSQKPKSGTSVGFAVGNGGWDDELDFCSSSVLTPHFQPSAKALGAFAHPREAPMSCAGALIGKLRVNSTSVVSNAQQKLGNAVCNFGLDLLRFRVTERVSQCFARNAVGFIAQQRIKVPLIPFHEHTHARSDAVVALRRQFLAQRG